MNKQRPIKYRHPFKCQCGEIISCYILGVQDLGKPFITYCPRCKEEIIGNIPDILEITNCVKKEIIMGLHPDYRIVGESSPCSETTDIVYFLNKYVYLDKYKKDSKKVYKAYLRKVQNSLERVINDLINSNNALEYYKAIEIAYYERLLKKRGEDIPIFIISKKQIKVLNKRLSIMAEVLESIIITSPALFVNTEKTIKFGQNNLYTRAVMMLNEM